MEPLECLPILIRPDQLAKKLGVAQVTVYSWVRRGVIPHLKLEGVVRFDPEEIAAWIKERRIAAKRPFKATQKDQTPVQAITLIEVSSEN